MQIAYAHRNGGTMHNAGSTKDSFTIAVVEACADKACFGQLKLQTGDILFFDDSHPHNFVTNDTIRFIVVSIYKSSLGSQRSNISKALDQCIRDTDTHFAITLNEIWKRFTQSPQNKRDTQEYKDAENEILSVIMKLLSEQNPSKPKLTSGEKTALETVLSLFLVLHLRSFYVYLSSILFIRNSKKVLRNKLVFQILQSNGDLNIWDDFLLTIQSYLQKILH